MKLVKYIEDNFIEGYVKTEDDFKIWLKEHNKNRIEEGNIKEEEHEFELIDIEELGF